jgi:hypothetical protein
VFQEIKGVGMKNYSIPYLNATLFLVAVFTLLIITSKAFLFGAIIPAISSNSCLGRKLFATVLADSLDCSV